MKCGADERRRRGLDRADPLSAPMVQMQTSLATRTTKAERAFALSAFVF